MSKRFSSSFWERYWREVLGRGSGGRFKRALGTIGYLDGRDFFSFPPHLQEQGKQ